MDLIYQQLTISGVDLIYQVGGTSTQHISSSMQPGSATDSWQGAHNILLMYTIALLRLTSPRTMLNHDMPLVDRSCIEHPSAVAALTSGLRRQYRTIHTFFIHHSC
jgi:hypothetical protein